MNHSDDQRLQLSVLLPVYQGDKAEWLHQSLLSIENQTWKASEIIVVQDGPVSAELSDELIYWKKRIPELKVVELKENQGIPAALNAGIQACSQPWIARMDADDIAMPNRFEIQWSYLRSHPDVVILGSWIDEYDETMSMRYATRKVPEHHRNILKFAHWRSPFNHQTVIYRREAVCAVGGYPPEKVMGEDYVLWTRLLHSGYISANIQCALVNVRAGKGLIARRKGLKYLLLEYKSMRMIYQMGFFTWYQYGMQLIIRTIVRLMPTRGVQKVYSWLRK
ncbi:MAG: glycosyltransferase [Thermaurantimonas sp.]